MYGTDKDLFIYLTKSSGHTLSEAAEAIGTDRSGLNRRLNGHRPFKQNEMEAWMDLVGVVDAGPVFFPRFVACRQQTDDVGG